MGQRSEQCALQGRIPAHGHLVAVGKKVRCRQAMLCSLDAELFVGKQCLTAGLRFPVEAVGITPERDDLQQEFRRGHFRNPARLRDQFDNVHTTQVDGLPGKEGLEQLHHLIPHKAARLRCAHPRNDGRVEDVHVNRQVDRPFQRVDFLQESLPLPLAAQVPVEEQADA